MRNYVTFKMSNGSVIGLKVSTIAMNRAKYYASILNVDVERSLVEDTVPLFESDENEILEWLKENMDWQDFQSGDDWVVMSQPKDPNMMKEYNHAEFKLA